MSASYSNYGASTSRPQPAPSSYKGKGKQRASESNTGEADDDGNNSDAADGPSKQPVYGSMSFSIRFTDGTTEDIVDLFVGDSESVREVKRRIRLLRTDLATNRLRLIYLGRIITDGIRLVPWIATILQRQKEQEVESQRRIAGIDFSVIEGAVKSAVHSLDDNAGCERDLEKGELSPKAKGKGKLVDKEQESHAAHGKKIWLHCSVGEPGSLQEETEATVQKQQEQLRPATGFDRLREAGFSEEDIDNIRQQFHEDGPADTAVAGDDDEHARALEEQWMESFQSGGADPANPGSGIYTTLFKGVVAGFFFPFLPLFFFRESSVFSKRMQMSIVAGCAINLLYGALRAFV